MGVSFKLSEPLRIFLNIGSSDSVCALGDKLPVSIRKRNHFSQSLIIYPECGYSFFSSFEVRYLLSYAANLRLDAFVSFENGLPVIQISDCIYKHK